jgi:pimeloyl-ACP methyl ester carboxylesterase
MEAAPVDDAIVLVHGLGGSSLWWRRVEPLLSERLAVHGIDLPSGYTIAAAPEFLLHELDRRRLSQVHLVGHSLGGLVAARAAARAPDRIGRLVLIAPAGIGLEPHFLQYPLPLLRTLLGLRPRFAATLVADAFRVGPRRLLTTARDLLADDALLSELPRVRAPTLLIWGERDLLVPPSLATAFLTALPDARLNVIPRAGHIAMDDAPHEIAALILEHVTARC